ncbi:MAG: hypothetical protein ABR583_09695 [Gaiellaceae bacterium]
MARLPAREQVRRDAEICRDRARGLTWATISERHGVTDRQCRAIWSARPSRVQFEGVDPFEELAEAIERVEAVVEDAALLGESAHDAVRAGALKTRLAALRELRELQFAAGLLPDPVSARTELDVRLLVATILQVFEDYGVGDEVADAILMTLRQRERAAPAALNGS